MAPTSNTLWTTTAVYMLVCATGSQQWDPLTLSSSQSQTCTLLSVWLLMHTTKISLYIPYNIYPHTRLGRGQIGFCSQISTWWCFFFGENSVTLPVLRAGRVYSWSMNPHLFPHGEGGWWCNAQGSCVCALLIACILVLVEMPSGLRQ